MTDRVWDNALVAELKPKRAQKQAMEMSGYGKHGKP
jgi:hypothetical protein